MGQLRWFTRLRWVAGGAVIAGSVAGRLGGGSYGQTVWMAGVGAGILLYNMALAVGLRRAHGRRQRLIALAGMQILLDLACLTVLVLGTGGVGSPLLGFFVFHMVFASLLMPRWAAYAGAVSAIAMVGAGLRGSGQWPGGREQLVMLCAWMVTLLFTVFLTNHITRALRRQRRRVRKLTCQMRRQQHVMAQHEKMAALGQMAAGVAHEIANPLASMDGLLQLMQRHPDRMRTAGAETVATLREQVKRINQIIEVMRGFAHPADALAQRLAVNDVVERSLEMLRFDARMKRVEVLRELAADADIAMMVSQAAQQVLVNLIVNALDAMAETATPRLTIRTLRRQGWCEIEVTDNGPGIPPQHRKHLFEPFFTTKPVGKGTGLGLAISHSLVEKQGGRITVKTKEGQGTSFTVHLPVEEAGRRAIGGFL